MSKLISTSEIAMVYFGELRFDEVRGKRKKLEIVVPATTFCFLWGFRGGFVVGVCWVFEGRNQ